VPQESHDPRKEELDVFEARINRAAKGLLMLGIEVAERQEEVLLEASAIKEVYGATTSLDPAVMVRTARDFFVGISIDPHISDRERRNRARGYASLIRTFGGKASEDPTKLFSTPYHCENRPPLATSKTWLNSTSLSKTIAALPIIARA